MVVVNRSTGLSADSASVERERNTERDKEGEGAVEVGSHSAPVAGASALSLPPAIL